MQLYKEDIILLAEFDNLKIKIEDLQKGKHDPNKESVKKAIES